MFPTYPAPLANPLPAASGQILAAGSLSVPHADPVCHPPGNDGLAAETWPPVDQTVMGPIGCHARSDGHDLTRDARERLMHRTDRHRGR